MFAISFQRSDGCTHPPRLIPLLAPALALALALACSDPKPRTASLEGPRPEGAVAEQAMAALAIPDSLDRVAAVASLLSGLGPDAIPEVVDAYEYAGPLLGDSEWMVLADWWTRHEPREAYGWVLSNRDHKTPGVLRYVIAGMVRTDPEGALLTMATLRDPGERRAAFQQLVRAWFDADRDALLEHVIELPAGGDRQRAIEVMAAMLVRREGLEATQAWAEDLDDDLPNRFKLQAFRRVASELALTDLDVAMRFAEKHADGPHGDGLFRRVTVRSITTEPERTMDWLAGLPNGKAQDEAVAEGFRRWISVDREAASAWLDAAPEGPWREPAWETYALSFGVEAPRKALQLIERLQDSERRHYAQAKVAVAWFSTDREAAEAWLAQADLPEEIAQKVLLRVQMNDERRAKDAERRERQRLRKERRAANALR